MRNSEWDSDVSEVDGFNLIIYSTDENTKMASIFEDRIHDMNNGNYYQVVNDPIDMEWVEIYIEKLQQQ